MPSFTEVNLKKVETEVGNSDDLGLCLDIYSARHANQKNMFTIAIDRGRSFHQNFRRILMRTYILRDNKTIAIESAIATEIIAVNLVTIA